MKNPFRKSSVGKLKDQLEKFESGLGHLRRREILVADLLEKGREKRRTFIRDNPGIEVPPEIRHAIGAAEGDARATAEEIIEYEQQIADLRAALVREEDRVAREADAKTVEDMATAIDQQVAPELEKSMAALRKAAEAFLAIVPEDLKLVESRSWARARGHAREYADHFDRQELLAGVVAEMIYAVAPSLFDRGKTYDTDLAIRRMFNLDAAVPTTRFDGAPPAALPDAHRALVSDRLRARAAAIRSGQDRPTAEMGSATHRPEAAPSET